MDSSQVIKHIQDFAKNFDKDHPAEIEFMFLGEVLSLALNEINIEPFGQDCLLFRLANGDEIVQHISQLNFRLSDGAIGWAAQS